MTTVSASTGAVVARAGDRERDREVGARLGDPHAARDARVDVVAGERDAGALLQHRDEHRRAGRRRTPARPGAGSARPVGATSACTSTHSGRVPSITAVDHRTGRAERGGRRGTARSDR